jgi:hypothetical protein
MLSTIIFIITRSWHNRPGVAAVPIVSQSKKKKKKKAQHLRIEDMIMYCLVRSVALFKGGSDK